MKITVWIRPGANERDITLRLDTKYESRDTPVIQCYGRRLADAIEGTTDADADKTKGTTK